MSTVGNIYTSELNYQWGQYYGLLDLDKTVHEVFLVASDAIMDASSDDVSTDAYYDDELKGTINFNPANNDT